MSDSTERAPQPVEVSHESLSDRREVMIRDDAIVVTHRIVSRAPVPTQFLIVDPFPGQFEIEEIAFHPEHEPDHGWLKDDRAAITGVVDPDGDAVIKYGFRTARQPPDDEIERLQDAVEPSVELAEAVELESPAALDLEQAAATRSSADVDGDAVGEWVFPTRSEAPKKPAEADAPDAAQASSEGASVTDSGDVGPSSGPEEARERSEDERSESTEPSAPLEDVLGLADDEVVSRPKDREPSATGLHGDPFGPSDDVRYLASSTARTHATASDSADSSRDGQDEPPADEAVDIVELFLQQLESEQLTPDQRRRLAEQFDELFEQRRPQAETTHVRLRHLESKLQALESYFDALEAIIDTHGPADAFLSDVRGDIDELESAIDDLQAAVDRAAEVRSAQSDWIDVLVDEVSDIDAGHERLVNRVESLDWSQRRETAELERRLETLEASLEEVRGLSDEMEAIRGKLEQIEARHQAIADALGRDR